MGSGEPLLGKISSGKGTCKFYLDNTTITEEEGSIEKFWMPKKIKTRFPCWYIILLDEYYEPSVYFEEKKVAEVDLFYLDMGKTELINKYKFIRPGRFECRKNDWVWVNDDGTRWQNFDCKCLPGEKEKISKCRN